MNSNLVNRCGGSPAGHDLQPDPFSQLGARHNLVLTQIAEAESTLKAEIENAHLSLRTSKKIIMDGLDAVETENEASIQSEENVLIAQLQCEQEEELAKMGREHDHVMELRKTEATKRITTMRSELSGSREQAELKSQELLRAIESENERKVAELVVKREAAQATATKEYLALLGQMAAPEPFQPPVAPVPAPVPAFDGVGSRHTEKKNVPIGNTGIKTGREGEQERQVSCSVWKDVPMNISSSSSPPLRIASSFQPVLANGGASDAKNRQRKTSANTDRRDLFGLSPGTIIVDHPNKRMKVGIEQPQGVTSSSYFASNNDDEFIDIGSLPLPPARRGKKPRVIEKPKVVEETYSSAEETPSPEPQPRRLIDLSRSSSSDVPLVALSQRRKANAPAGSPASGTPLIVKQIDAARARFASSSSNTPPVANLRRAANTQSRSSPAARPRPSISQRQAIDLNDSLSPKTPIPAMGHHSWNGPGPFRPDFAPHMGVAPHVFGQSGRMRSFEVLRIRFDRLTTLDESLWGLNPTANQTLQLHLDGNSFVPRTAGEIEKWHPPEWTIIPANVSFVRYNDRKARLRIFRKHAGDSKGFLWIDFANGAVLDGFLAQFRPMFLMKPGNIMPDEELSFYPER